MDKYLQSAIIGFWRMGATITEMKEATGVNPIAIFRVIDNYKLWL